MRSVIVFAAMGVALAGCSSFSLSSMDLFKPAPTMVTVQLDSKPQGATATTSAGASCATPCSLELAAAPGLTVTYTLDRYLPQTVALQVVQHQGAAAADGTAPIVTDFDPNPVMAELQPVTPPHKARKPAVHKKKPAPQPQAAATPEPAQTGSTAASAAPAAASPFPPPQVH